MSDNKTIDQQFIEYVVQSLVSNPDDVVVERTIDEKGVLLTLTVNPEDLGRVIGKRGATAQSLRTLLRALGTKQEARYNLKIVDNGVPREERVQNNDKNEEKAEETEAPETKESAPVEGGWGDDDTSETEVEEKETESSVERTRRELEDLDDLDV